MNRWIPVTERLPEEDGKYLVTQKVFNHNTIRICYYSNNLKEVDEYDFEDEKGFYEFSGEWGHYSLDDILAWMPLPEEYKEVQEEELNNEKMFL